jgi:single-strand DNA-binding protein
VNETTVTVVGNLVDDPTLRQTESGVEVAGFRVASTSRRYDRESGRWVDAGTLFLPVSCWRSLAANVGASLGKGDPVIVTGRLFTRTYERDGQTRTSYDLEALAVGPDLARGRATFQRTPRAPVPSAHVATDATGVPEGAPIDAVAAVGSSAGAEPVEAEEPGERG